MSFAPGFINAIQDTLRCDSADPHMYTATVTGKATRQIDPSETLQLYPYALPEAADDGPARLRLIL